MSDLKNILKDIGYFGVGAAAVILEAGGKAIRSLVRKGEETLRENQDTVDGLKRKAKAAGEKIKEAAQDLNKKVETPEVEIPNADEPVVDVPVADEPEVDVPVTPDAIYRTGEPAPSEDFTDVFVDDDATEEPEKPEETING